jgi:hypothetical protein
VELTLLGPPDELLWPLAELLEVSALAVPTIFDGKEGVKAAPVGELSWPREFPLLHIVPLAESREALPDVPAE